MAAATISFELIMRVREFYTMAYQEISSNEQKRVMSDNGITDYAIPSYILSVAAVEAFVNEVFLALSSGFLKGTSFEQLSQDEIKKFREKKSLGDKLIKLPELAFDQEVFNSNHQPFQDMNYLIKVRDSFVHYKMAIEPEDKGIFDYLVRHSKSMTQIIPPSYQFPKLSHGTGNDTIPTCSTNKNLPRFSRSMPPGHSCYG